MSRCISSRSPVQTRLGSILRPLSRQRVIISHVRTLVTVKDLLTRDVTTLDTHFTDPFSVLITIFLSCLVSGIADPMFLFFTWESVERSREAARTKISLVILKWFYNKSAVFVHS